MSEMLFDVNTVQADILNYYLHVRGEPKIGKTQLAYEIFKNKFNNDMSKSVLISIGKENGYKACDGMQFKVVKTWSELLKVKKALLSGGHNIEFVVLDTTDELVRLAEIHVIETSFTLGLSKGGKKTLNSAYGGYGEGRRKIAELVTEVIDELLECFGLMTLGHTKLKEIKEKNGEAYLQLASRLNNDYEYIFGSKADISAVISIDKQYEEREEENFVGKTVTKAGYLSGARRVIRFRSDDYRTDCGSRFPDIVDEIDYSPKGFIEAIESAIEDSKLKGFTKGEIKEQGVARQKKINKKMLEVSKEGEIDELVEIKALVLESIEQNFESLSDNFMNFLTGILEKEENEGKEMVDIIDAMDSNEIEELQSLL